VDTIPPDHSLGEGVYYASEAYAGLTRRLLVIVVDVAAMLAVAFLVAILYTLAGVDVQQQAAVFWITLFIIAWVYLALLKQSRIRTIGYRLTGTRIVDLRGQRPSIRRMTLRTLLSILGPFSFPVDLIWISVDSDRRTLRDCFVGTYVIANDAQPVGRGEIHLTYFWAFGYTLTYPHVLRPLLAAKGS